MNWLASLALTVACLLPAAAQTNPSLELMQNMLRSTGITAPVFSSSVLATPELQQLTYPSGHAIERLNAFWPLLMQGQWTLPSGASAFFPSALPGCKPGLPIELDKSGDMPGQPVENYSCMHSGTHPCRFSSDMLPLRVYSPLPERRAVVDKSIALWNEAGQKALKSDLFRQVTDPAQAQIKLDWSGVNVPANCVGVTPFRIYSNRVEIGEISILNDAKLTESDLTAVLRHELGHTLGLNHSNLPQDLMYTHHMLNSEHGGLTQRDSWMLGWLYSQKNAIPMVVQ